MLLREFVEAGEIEFRECETFQVVCPSCREAVFKKTRRSQTGEVTHFLSHYRADGPDDRDCELRVDAIPHERLEAMSTEGRLQTLDGFMAILRTAILRGQEPLYEPGQLKPWIDRVLSRPVFSKFDVYAREAMALTQRFPDPRAVVASMLAEFPRYSERSPFWQRRQAAYVVDVIRHLLAPNSRPNFQFLAAASLIHIGSRAAEYRAARDKLALPDIGYDPQIAVDLIEGLVNGKSEKAMQAGLLRAIGADKARTQAEMQAAQARNADVHRAMVGELLGPIVGILGAVPFPELAKDRNAVFKDHNGVEKLWAAIQELMEGLEGEADGQDGSKPVP